MEDITIKRSEYDDLKSRAGQVAGLESRVSELEDTAGKVPDLERKIEETETAKVAAEKDRDDFKAKVEESDETARKATLSKDRLGKLGKGFTDKLGEFTRGRLEEQAGALSDEEWDNRLKELEETADVKRDEGKTAAEADKDGTVTREETARSQIGGGNGNGGSGGEPGAAERRSVVAGLVKGTK